MAKENNSENNKNKKWDAPFLLAAFIVPVCILGIFYLSKIVMKKGTYEEAKDILNLLLPVFGTWIGTVLAYYFSRENFESASKSMKDVVRQLTPMQKLKSILIKDKMIPRKLMTFLNRAKKPLKQVNLKSDLLENLLKDKSRLPVLDKDDHPMYIIHKSMIDGFIAQKALEGGTTLDKFSLKDLLDQDVKLKSMFENSFAVVKEEATLADAKVAMEKIDDCQDVFITKNGTKAEPVLGWLTNIIIAENAKV